MTGREGVHLLVNIVAKGGNLLLNIAPGPDGTWQQGAYDLLNEMGAWMKVNSEAIYETRAIEPFKMGNIALTQKNNKEVYCIYMADEGETRMPSKIVVPQIQPVAGAKVSMLGSDEVLNWKIQGDGFVIDIPARFRKSPPSAYAWSFKVSEIK